MGIQNLVQVAPREGNVIRLNYLSTMTKTVRATEFNKCVTHRVLLRTIIALVIVFYFFSLVKDNIFIYFDRTIAQASFGIFIGCWWLFGLRADLNSFRCPECEVPIRECRRRNGQIIYPISFYCHTCDIIWETYMKEGSS